MKKLGYSVFYYASIVGYNQLKDPKKLTKQETIEVVNKTFTGKNNFTGKINGFDCTKEELNPIKNDKN